MGQTISDKREMDAREFTESQLWGIARAANAASGAQEHPYDPRSVESFMIWAGDDRVPEMTAWQIAAWKRIKALRAVIGAGFVQTTATTEHDLDGGK